MRKEALFSLVALLLAACNSIPPKLPVTCLYNIVVMSPGVSIASEPSEILPGHIDIVSVSSVLEGERLNVTFHLRDIPHKMEFNRKGVPALAIEYLWVVAISTVGDPYLSFHNFDYWLEASYTVSEREIKRPPLLVDVEGALDGHLFRYSSQSSLGVVTMGLEHSDVDVVVAHENDTLAVSGRIPGINPSSTIAFSAMDYKESGDIVNCNSSYYSQLPIWSRYRRIIP